MRVLSLTRDAEDRGGRFPEFDRCWARPRMGEQYSDDHRGACLLFDRNASNARSARTPARATSATSSTSARRASSLSSPPLTPTRSFAAGTPPVRSPITSTPTATPSSSSRATTSPRSGSTASCWRRTTTATTATSTRTSTTETRCGAWSSASAPPRGGDAGPPRPARGSGSSSSGWSGAVADRVSSRSAESPRSGPPPRVGAPRARSTANAVPEKRGMARGACVRSYALRRRGEGSEVG
jgi:hypothetical protein